MGTVTGERPYAGQTTAERKRARRAALIEAGLELLGTQGAQAATVRAVCRQAGLTSRYFYENFTSLDELLVAVFDDVMATMTAGITEALAGTDGSVAAAVSAFGTTFVTSALDDPRATRIGFIEAWGNETLMRRRVETLHNGAHLLAGAVTAGADGQPAGDGAVAVAAFVVVGGLLQSVLAWLDGSLQVTREALIANFTRTAIAALNSAVTSGTEPAARRPS
jgi:AcrR family transcriptional regulator